MDRSSLINFLASLNNYTSYLEVGYGTGACFHSVLINQKLGIDIGYGVPKDDLFCHITTSSELLSKNISQGSIFTFDICFIDGSHLCEDVIEDIRNCSSMLSSNGVIILHDCLPPSEDWQLRLQSPRVPGWMGDVWRAASAMLNSPFFSGFTVDSDCGMSVLYKTPYYDFIQLKTVQPLSISYQEWYSSRKSIMNIIDPLQLQSMPNNYSYSSSVNLNEEDLLSKIRLAADEKKLVELKKLVDMLNT